VRLAILLLCLVPLTGIACRKKSAAIAELVKAAGPVDRQHEDAQWKGVQVGAEFFIGDAARTGDGTAQLTILGGAQIAMQPHTVLRFGGKAGSKKIAVELGAIDLIGTGNYTLDVGDVNLKKNGAVRITAKGNGEASIELTLGEAQVTTVQGSTIDLVVGKVVELGLDVVVTTIVDAGVPDAVAVADAPADAPPVDGEEGEIVVAGKKADVQREGEKNWTNLPAGKSPLEKGSTVRIGNATTAKLTAHGTVLDLGGSSRAVLDKELAFSVETGTAHTVATSDAKIALPGGALLLKGTDKVAADAKLDLTGAGAKVTMQRGSATLTGTGGSELVLNRGESATLMKSGQIRPLEAIPSYFDFRITVGETFTIHDPRPPSAVQFHFGGKCPEGGIIEMDRDGRYRTAKVSAGKESANHLVKPGRWAYRLRCTRGGDEGGAVASGVIAVIADSGTRALPKLPPVNTFDVDGRPWSYSYQSVIPDLDVKFPGGGSSFKLHLARGGKELTFDSAKPTLRLQGSQLTEGRYTYWFDRDGVKQDKVNTLSIEFDQTAPQVYIESPGNGTSWSGDVPVKGAVLPGWTAAVEGVAIPIDKQRRFNANVQPPAGKAIAIRVAHPQRGVHYYLRRQK
jgi:hypothetical protein